jgi:hypothetical protein
MRVEENFERCVQRLFKLLQFAQEKEPGASRILYLDVQGHRNMAGGFDRDAFELMSDFLCSVLMQYLTEAWTPLVHLENLEGQRNDMPSQLVITPPSDGIPLEYDVLALEPRSREDLPDRPASKASRQAIASYLDTDQSCQICWAVPAQRAHAVPKSLGGSSDVRNFALLCDRHHKEAPDVADAEAFWAWVDYASERDGHEKLGLVAPERLRKLGVRKSRQNPPAANSGFWAAVREELVELYGWNDQDFRMITPELLAEYHDILDKSTTKHFNVERKVSTHAWAYDVSRKRLLRIS